MRAASGVFAPVASRGPAMAATAAERGPVAAIGMPPSIMVLGMGRVPRRLALPPVPRWERPRRRTLTLATATAACAAIIPMDRAIRPAVACPLLSGCVATTSLPIGDDLFPKALYSRNPDRGLRNLLRWNIPAEHFYTSGGPRMSS